MIGRRGSYLLLMAMVHISVGIGYLLPAQHTAGTRDSLAFLVTLGLPLWTAGLPWLASAIPAIWSAFIRLPHTDKFGFMSLAAMQVAWAIIYAMGWAIGDSQRGWFLAVVFGALAGATFVVSGMIGAKDISKAHDDLGSIHLIEGELKIKGEISGHS